MQQFESGHAGHAAACAGTCLMHVCCSLMHACCLITWCSQLHENFQAHVEQVRAINARLGAKRVSCAHCSRPCVVHACMPKFQ